MQTLFSSLLLALLFQTSHLVLEGGTDSVQDGQHVTEGTDPVRYGWHLGPSRLASTSSCPTAACRARSQPAAPDSRPHPAAGTPSVPTPCFPCLVDFSADPAFIPADWAEAGSMPSEPVPTLLLAACVTQGDLTDRPPACPRGLSHNQQVLREVAGRGQEHGAWCMASWLLSARPQFLRGGPEDPAAERWVRGPRVLRAEARGLGAAHQPRQALRRGRAAGQVHPRRSLAGGAPSLRPPPWPRPGPEHHAPVRRAMVIKSCWHNRPIFSFAASVLQELGCRNHLTALAFMTEVSSYRWGQAGEGSPPKATAPIAPRGAACLPVSGRAGGHC